ncbi:hypothetical protein PGIGA_G00166360 [Pangasianodon gigas]|uniref:Uncharacterized protein n=1 Tax=Pangasianodon gigas TaxID=30993 RepID=A0ACC5XTH2_PANGG|nr:hypothetical protein [Pangasianodon gigas]
MAFQTELALYKARNRLEKLIRTRFSGGGRVARSRTSVEEEEEEESRDHVRTCGPARLPRLPRPIGAVAG